ncbi:MAG: flagellar basal body rod protein FlgC [Candidatus Hydrogenedentota bacterium]
MSIYNSYQISGSGLTAQRTRLDVIANNIANAETSRGLDGKPYIRKRVIFQPIGEEIQFRWFLPPGDPRYRLGIKNSGEGVRILGIEDDRITPFRKIYDPTHPDADKDGYVLMPNINIIEEMVNMIDATRAYEANAQALRAAKTMDQRALDIGR